ncbi:MAG: alpha/beta hydrolase [Lachnospiraceae bacterium]|nr:alpha/beta hydrolase [Lachnospiraceae bacterium]
MKVYEFGEEENPVLLLLPGTMSYWKGNFGQVIPELSKDFLVAVVAYTGFDEKDSCSYGSSMEEIEALEEYITKHYGGKILAAYGCSLGGSLVSHLVHRNHIHMKYGIIGSSDMDQAGNLKAEIMAKIIVKMMYNYIHTGKFKSKMIQKWFDKQLSDPYNRGLISMIGRDQFDMSFITRESIKNQFKSDLTTKLPVAIDSGETKVHVLYSKKMGKKYRQRYEKHFKNPIIHEMNLQHEELLAVYPEKWCQLIKEICN